MGCCLSKDRATVEETKEINTSSIPCPNMESTENSREDEDSTIQVERHASSKSDILCGVSNVVYRKEYIQNMYTLTPEELGTGVSGSVCVVVDRETNERFALKTINLAGLSPSQRERVITESMILARMHHPNIVKLYEVYESNSAVYLIMELLSGGELFERLMAQPDHKFDENCACLIIKDILNAITYLHDYKNIVHRDLKLSNIMYSSNSPNAELKLIDFGLSKLMANTDYTHSLVGTRNYIAPEVYMKEYRGIGYTKSCDMWSIGIIAYFLLTGRNPIPNQLENVDFNHMKKTKIPYPRKYWNGISTEAKSFVESLLQLDPMKRLTASQAQEHPWFRMHCTAVYPSLSPSILRNLKAFQGFNRLKKAAMTAVAYHLSSKELQQLGAAFEFFDHNNTGTITMDEFKQAILILNKFAADEHDRVLKSASEKDDALNCTCHELSDLPKPVSSPSSSQANEESPVLSEGILPDPKSSGTINEIYDTVTSLSSNEALLIELFNDIDFNKTGYIDYSEFLAACLAKKEDMKREYAQLIFDLIDREHKGTIQLEDLHVFFGESIPMEEIQQIIKCTFNEERELLTEADLEQIMRTRMINNPTTATKVEEQNKHGNRALPTKTGLDDLFGEFKMNSVRDEERDEVHIICDSAICKSTSPLELNGGQLDEAKMRFTSIRAANETKYGNTVEMVDVVTRIG